MGKLNKRSKLHHEDFRADFRKGGTKPGPLHPKGPNMSRKNKTAILNEKEKEEDTVFSERVGSF